MKDLLNRGKNITISSAVCLVIYIATNWVVTAFTKEVQSQTVALILFSIFLMGIFAFLLVYFTYIRTESGKEIVRADYPDASRGVISDIKLVFKQEINTFAAILAINLAVWLIISVDKLIFAKRTFSAILLLYAPLNIIGVVLPDWANEILSYIIGSILCSAIYLVLLVLVRKKWYKSKKQ